MSKSKRGFASMTPERRKEIASLGGKSSPSNFKLNPERAAAAGRIGARNQSLADKAKGGKNSWKSRKAVEAIKTL